MIYRVESPRSGTTPPRPMWTPRPARRCRRGNRPSTPWPSPDTEPAYVARLGTVDVRGIEGGTEHAERAIRYVTKYITKDLVDHTFVKRHRPAGALRPAPRRAGGAAVLAAVRELAALRRAARGRQDRTSSPAGAGARSTRRPPSATPAGAASSPATGPTRPSPTTASTDRTGSGPSPPGSSTTRSRPRTTSTATSTNSPAPDEHDVASSAGPHLPLHRRPHAGPPRHPGRARPRATSRCSGNTTTGLRGLIERRQP